MRGDNLFINEHVFGRDGTPPHAWGQHTIRDVSLHSVRYTPTCVGTTFIALNRFLDLPVHPHMRGDNFQIYHSTHFNHGTPPHAWGQQYHVLFRLFWYRYTPTCVGTTQEFYFFFFNHSVHPHMRGDNILTFEIVSSQAGTPPHAWGQLYQKYI